MFKSRVPKKEANFDIGEQVLGLTYSPTHSRVGVCGKIIMLWYTEKTWNYMLRTEGHQVFHFKEHELDKML